jgi:hypothetical protein
MMETASTSETSVNFYQTTRRNNPEYSYLQFVLRSVSQHLPEGTEENYEKCNYNRLRAYIQTWDLQNRKLNSDYSVTTFGLQ